MSQPPEQDVDRQVRFEHVAVEGAVRSTQREHHHPGEVCRDCAQGTGSGAVLLDGMQRHEEVLGGSLVDVKGLDTHLRSCYSL